MWIFLLLTIVLTHATKTLVIVRDLVDKTTYSLFLRDLKNRGHSLTFKTAGDSSIQLESYGEYNYDNLVLLSPNSKKVGDVGTKALMQFLDSGRNIFMLVGESPTKMYKNVAGNLGVDIRSQLVMDHFNQNALVQDSKNHTFITTSSIFSKLKSTDLPVSYRGIAFMLKQKTQFGLHLLTAESTGYNKHGSGSDLGLVTTIQMRNNARCTFVGSAALLSNEAALSEVSVKGKRSQSGNAEFVRQAVAFTFHEVGVLRSSNAKHFLLDGSGPPNPNRYTIKEEVRYEVLIEEYHMSCGCWKPYTGTDVQFQLIRLDPFIRMTMDNDGEGLYYLEFMLPDTFGIFKFVVDYKRFGYTYLYEELEASVRPLRHDQHPRFLLSAYPYYAASLSMAVGFFVFAFLFVNSEPKKEKKE